MMSSNDSKPAAGPRQSILSVVINDKAALRQSYMPFVKNGGLFVPTKNTYSLGNEVFVLLTLMDEREKLPFAGRVVWITPKGAQGNRPPGIGVQFHNDQTGNAVRNKIETYLGGALKSDLPTYTM
jgi:type IV pilus assembly protein PilZ